MRSNRVDEDVRESTKTERSKSITHASARDLSGEASNKYMIRLANSRCIKSKQER